MTSVGVALGGGGAKGLAHIAVLDVLDRLGVDVVAISGTSIGAVIGALYSAGLSGAEIREAINALLERPDSFDEAWKSKRFFGWLDRILIAETCKSRPAHGRLRFADCRRVASSPRGFGRSRK